MFIGGRIFVSIGSTNRLLAEMSWKFVATMSLAANCVVVLYKVGFSARGDVPLTALRVTGFKNQEISSFNQSKDWEDVMDFPSMLLSSEASERALVVRKKQSSNRVRFLFVAGLGGTGHHGWQAVLEEGKVCKSSPSVKNAIKRLWFGEDSQSDRYAIELKAAFRKTASAVNLLDNSTLFCVHLVHGPMLSYPEKNNPTHHPNVWSLARLAEDSGVDLRIIVIHRHPANQLVSLSLHRHYMDLANEAHQMSNQGAILNSQLQLVDPNFFICTSFSTAVNDRFDIEQHVIGGMAGFEINKMSKAIKRFYRAEQDDPYAASREIQKAMQDNSARLKIDEMEFYYRYLTGIICPARKL